MGSIKWSIFGCKGGAIQHANAHEVFIDDFLIDFNRF
jgi:hypothetical protein